MTRYRIEVGHCHEVKPGNIVGAIANEGKIDSAFIGRIQIMDDHSFVDLPQGLSKEVLDKLRKARVAAQKLNLTPATEKSSPGTKPSARPHERKKPRHNRSSNANDKQTTPKPEIKKEKKKLSAKEKRLKKKAAKKRQKKAKSAAVNKTAASN